MPEYRFTHSPRLISNYDPPVLVDANVLECISRSLVREEKTRYFAVENEYGDTSKSK